MARPAEELSRSGRELQRRHHAAGEDELITLAQSGAGQPSDSPIDAARAF